MVRRDTCDGVRRRTTVGDVILLHHWSADGKLASLSQPSTSSKLETETADDFIPSETTVIRGATITGLVVPHPTLASIDNVEVEIHRVFPNDSQPPSAACRRE